MSITHPAQVNYTPTGGASKSLADELDLLATFTPTGTGAVARTISDKLAETVSVKDFGAVGDGIADDTTAFVNALAVSKRVFVPNPATAYLINSTIAIPANTLIVGANKWTTKILLGANVDLFTMADGARLQDLYLEGNGTVNTTARGIVISGTAGHQGIIHCKVVNFGGFAIEFTLATAGSQFLAMDSEIWRTAADFSGHPGVFSVKIQDAVQLGAVPRKFIGIETAGMQFIDFGGSNDVFVSNCFTGGFGYSANSRGVLITGTRIANQTALTVLGHNNAIVGCDVLPAITVGASTDHIIIGPNSQNTDAVTDNSFHFETMITSTPVVYTPTLTASTTNPTIGNGVIRGEYARNGAVIHAVVEYTVGSTDTPGTGVWRFSLPVTPPGQTGGPPVQFGHGYARQNSTSTFEFILPLVVNNTAYVVLQRAGAGGPQVNNAAPWVWATGDIIRFSVDYHL